MRLHVIIATLLFAIGHDSTMLAKANSVHGYRIEDRESIDSMMSSGLWNFGDAEVLDHATLHYICQDDSTRSEYLPILRTDFNITEHGRKVPLRLEGRDWFMNIDSIETSATNTYNTYNIVKGVYRKFQQRDEPIRGMISTIDTHGHTAIFPTGDTLCNLRAEQMFMNLTIGAGTPSVDSTKSRNYNFRIVRLYESDANTPAVICMESNYLGRLADASTTYIFPSLEQSDVSKLNARQKSNNAKFIEPSPLAIQPTVAVDIRIADNNIIVHADISLLPALVTVYDITGRLLLSRKIDDSNRTIYNLPFGELLLTIYPDNKTIAPLSQKVHINQY